MKALLMHVFVDFLSFMFQMLLFYEIYIQVLIKKKNV